MEKEGENERGERAKEKEEKREKETERKNHFLPCPLNEENYGSCKEEHPDEIAP